MLTRMQDNPFNICGDKAANVLSSCKQSPFLTPGVSLAPCG